VGTFTAVDTALLSAVVAKYGHRTVRSWKPIAAGTINSNFWVQTEVTSLFVRINEGKSEADVAWEANLVLELASAGVPTPRPFFSLEDGKPYTRLPGKTAKWVTVFSWEPGAHVAPDEVSPTRAHTLGAALATLHLAGLALPAHWRRSSIYDHAHLVGRFESFRRSSDPVLAPAIALIADELKLAEEAAPVRARATQGLIHGDLFRDNVLWHELDRERLLAILDFEQASGGSLAYDLAVCINDWCWTGEPRIDLARFLLMGYQTVRPLSPGDREALPVELRAAATRFTITRITDVYLAKVENPEKDFRAFLARAEAWRGPSLRELTAKL
jgi:homoserine kinase type II